MAWLTRSGSAGSANSTVGLSAVGPPPVTSSSQVPARRSTALVPPYSRTSSAATTSRQKFLARSRSATTRMWVSSVPAGNAPAVVVSVIGPPRVQQRNRPGLLRSSHGPNDLDLDHQADAAVHVTGRPAEQHRHPLPQLPLRG